MAENTNRMGVVGERDAVLAFKAVGMRVIPVQTPAETTAALHKLSTAAEKRKSGLFINQSCKSNRCDLA